MSVEDPLPLSVLRHRSFAYFWAARVSGSLASQMQAVAVGWQIYELTSDPFDLGLVGLVQFFPLIAFMILAGHVADRYDRRTIVRVRQLGDGTTMPVRAGGTAGAGRTSELTAGGVSGCATVGVRRLV